MAVWQHRRWEWHGDSYRAAEPFEGSIAGAVPRLQGAGTAPGQAPAAPPCSGLGPRGLPRSSRSAAGTAPERRETAPGTGGESGERQSQEPGEKGGKGGKAAPGARGERQLQPSAGSSELKRLREWAELQWWEQGNVTEFRLPWGKPSCSPEHLTINRQRGGIASQESPALQEHPRSISQCREVSCRTSIPF